MKHILLVGGDEHLRHSFEVAVKKKYEECEITFFAKAREAFRELEITTTSYDILAVDCQLLEMNALNFCKELKNGKFQAPIIILLEKEMADTAAEALKIGIDDFIIKDEKEHYLELLPFFLMKTIQNFNDSQARIKTETALKECEEKFWKAFMLSPSPIALSTLEEGRIVEINDTGIKYFGHSRDEIIGKTTIELNIIKPEDRETIKKLYSEQDSFRNFELKLYTFSGEERICLLSGQRITIDGKEYVIQSVNDITERKKLEEERLKNKNLESIGILAGGIARDFNNILTSIMGNISIAKLSLHDTEKIHRSLSRAEDICLKAVELANKLITFSAGGEPIYNKVFINPVIKEVIDHSTPLTDVTFDYRRNYNIWPVLGDDTQIHQIFSSIIRNSIDAMPNGGEVTIETENIHLTWDNEFALREGDYVSIIIKDTGVGIPEEDLDKI
jgi:two-component system, cell cycle sensor histidine kinase and response regulator CckA